MGLSVVLNALGPAVTAAINNAAPILNALGNPVFGKVARGWPFTNPLTEILGQGGYFVVTLYALPGGRDSTQYRPQAIAIAPPTVTLTATIAGNIITFGGTPAANLNIHVFPEPNVDEYYRTTAEDTLDSIAAAVAALVGGTSSGPTATVPTVIGELVVNIGGSVTGTSVSEVGRSLKHIQVSSWAPDDAVRDALRDAIIAGIGTAYAPYIPGISDGTYAKIDYLSDSDVDQSQSSYSLYESHVVFAVDYAQTLAGNAVQIEAVQAAVATNESPPVTTIGP